MHASFAWAGRAAAVSDFADERHSGVAIVPTVS